MKLKTGSVLSGASVLAFSLSPLAASIALAQSADTGAVVLEEMVVSGTRGSLQRAVDIKRDTVGMFDGVSAEDLGKFPDANIAEALQRVPGVTIDRNGGEGQFVTVRGFGPAFNTVLVNGRRVASEVGGREFSFDLFPSELISGADIHKSGVARLQEGGIGSTINLSTARPLEQGGFKSVITGRALNDENSGETTPQIFGLVSNTFADDTIGVLVSASYQERESQLRTLDNRGYVTGDVSSLAGTVDNPGNAERFFVPQNVQLGEIEQNRERTNLQTVLQFQPSEDLLITVDGMYNEFTLESESRFLNTWFSLGSLDNFVLDGNGTALSFDQNADGAIEARAENDGRPTQTTLAGINVRWTPSDSFEHGFDFSTTSSENKPSGADTGQSVLGFRSPYSFRNTSFGTENPYVEFSVPGSEVLDTSNYSLHVVQFGGESDATEEANVVDSSITEFRYDGVFTPDVEGVEAIRFGFNLSDESKDVDIVRTQPTPRCFYCGFFVDVPANLEDVLLFPVTDDLLSAGQGGYVDSTGAQVSTFLGNSLAMDGAAFGSAELLSARDVALGLDPGTSAAVWDSYNGLEGIRQVNSFAVDEEIMAFYIDTDLAGQAGDMTWAMNVGLRWVDTTTKSTGNRTPLIDLTINGLDTTEYNRVLGDVEAAFITEESDNRFLLPSMNLKLDMTDNLVARFGVSQTLARPQLTDLAPRFNIVNTRPNSLVATDGNFALEPFMSSNLDFGLEYYFDEFSYVAVSYFDKRVDNFIVNTTEREDLTILNSDNIVDPRIDGTTASFDVTRPTNSETADVQGVELSGQFMFDGILPFDGLGMTANILLLDSNAEVGSNTADRVNFGLPGLSDSQNLQLFYSAGAWDARISYSRRDEFLETLSNVIGGEPVFVEEFAQVDFKLNYTFGSEEAYSVFLEGTNIFGEEIRKKSNFDNQFIELTDTGTRFGLGIRAEF